MTDSIHHSLTNSLTRCDHTRIHDGHGDVLYARRAGQKGWVLVYVALLGSISASERLQF